MSFDVLDEARTLKKQARRYRESEKYGKAEEALNRAVKLLERARSEILSEDPSHAEAEVVRELADCYGSLGGVLRSAGRFGDSVAAYDKSYELESDKTFGIVSSYALVQRLVARILFQPELIGSDSWCVLGVDVAHELVEAERAIEEQRNLRAGDAWAVADRALVSLLLLRPEDVEGKIWEEFQKTPSSSYAAESTLRTVSDLLTRIGSVRRENDSRRFHKTFDRLIPAQKLLEKVAA